MRVLVENGFVNKIRSLKPATLVAMVVVLGLALAVPVTIYQTQQRQDLQQSAAEFATGKKPPCVNLGDINGDGVITIVESSVRGTPAQYPDANLITQYVNQAATLTPQQISIADVNADGNVTAADALMIGRFAQGLETTFPICAKTVKVALLTCGYYGDINGDKKITELDGWEIQKYVSAFPSLLKDNSYLQKSADVNADGKVDIVDPLLINNYVNGRTNTFTACTKTKPVPANITCSYAPAPGDVDGDGLVTDMDGQMVGIHVVGLTIPGLTPITDAAKLKNADADNNGKVDMVDGLFISRYAQGLDAVLKGCTVSVTTPTPTTILCTSNSQCPSSNACILGKCVSAITPTPTIYTYCRRDTDCPTAYVCNTTTNSCYVKTTPTPTPIPSMQILGNITTANPVGQAPVGTLLQAYINGNICGETRTVSPSTNSPWGFSLIINSASQMPGCGTASGGLITFKVNGASVSNTSAYIPGGNVVQGFTINAQTPTPSPYIYPPYPTVFPSSTPYILQ